MFRNEYWRSWVRRLAQQVNGDLLDAAISAWLTHHTTGDDRTDGIVLAQRQVEQKTSEIAWFAPCWTRST